MLVVLGLFMLTYITIRLLPSPATPAHRRTCRNPGPVQLVQPPVHTPEDLSGYGRLLAQYEDNTPGEALQATHLDIDTCLTTSCNEEDAASSEVHAQAEIMTTTGLGRDVAVRSSSSVDEQSMVASDETHCPTAAVDSNSMDYAQQGLCVEDKGT